MAYSAQHKAARPRNGPGRFVFFWPASDAPCSCQQLCFTLHFSPCAERRAKSCCESVALCSYDNKHWTDMNPLQSYCWRLFVSLSGLVQARAGQIYPPSIYLYVSVFERQRKVSENIRQEFWHFFSSSKLFQRHGGVFEARPDTQTHHQCQIFHTT